MGRHRDAATDAEGGGRRGDPLPRPRAPRRRERPDPALTGAGDAHEVASAGTEAAQRLAEALGALRHTLRFHRDMGVTHLTLAGEYFLGPGEALARQERELQGCQRCRLAGGRHTIVFGAGNPRADFVCIGEGPGADEDAQGLPFVGRAGQLLTRMLEAIQLGRDDVYILNAVKCRPPGNRNPEPDELAACAPFLQAQLAVVQPKVILSLGSIATQTLLATREPIGKLRGRVHVFGRAVLVPTFHPAFLLRNPGPEYKRMAFEDLKLARREYDLRRTPTHPRP